MSRLAVLNMLIGFIVLSLIAAAGSFIATDMTEAFLNDKEILFTWETMLLRSAHGHTNLFAVLHICFGLTMSYSTLSIRIKKLQTWGLFLGTFAMGPLMFWRAKVGPVSDVDATELLIGLFLSCALVALVSHSYGLAMKYHRHE